MNKRSSQEIQPTKLTCKAVVERARETESSMADTCAVCELKGTQEQVHKKCTCSRERPSVRIKSKANDYSIHSQQLKWQIENAPAEKSEKKRSMATVVCALFQGDVRVQEKI